VRGTKKGGPRAVALDQEGRSVAPVEAAVELHHGPPVAQPPGGLEDRPDAHAARVPALSSRAVPAKPRPRPGDAHRCIHAVVRRIPRGRVATYGQVARLAGLGAQPRLVGYALAALPGDSDLPWHRVVDAQGRVSPRATPGAEALQRALLERERVRFDARGRIDLARHRWRPRGL
jgi:methylated-DNA-protein-cysteine methyltransferase-like protein